jgi:predicted lipoprotein
MHRRRRWIVWTAVAGGTAVFLYFLPLFHVVHLEQAGPRKGEEAFDAAAFLDRFWAERLIPGAEQAVDAAELIPAIDRDRESARQTYGRSIGLGSIYYYFVAGTGRIVSIEKDSVGLSLQDGQDDVHVSLAAGNIFGNAVRDGTSLLDVNNFANSQDFNTLSSEINRRIEEQVLPAFRNEAAIGAQVRFVGCAEIVDEDADLQPLRIVPFVLEQDSWPDRS